MGAAGKCSREQLTSANLCVKAHLVPFIHMQSCLNNKPARAGACSWPTVLPWQSPRCRAGSSASLPACLQTPLPRPCLSLNPAPRILPCLSKPRCPSLPVQTPLPVCSVGCLPAAPDPARLRPQSLLSKRASGCGAFSPPAL